MAIKEVQVPDIGDFDQVAVVEVLVKPGDRIAAEAPLVSLESDKATMDVPSPYAGTVQEVKIAAGAIVGKTGETIDVACLAGSHFIEPLGREVRAQRVAHDAAGLLQHLVEAVAAERQLAELRQRPLAGHHLPAIGHDASVLLLSAGRMRQARRMRFPPCRSDCQARARVRGR